MFATAIRRLAAGPKPPPLGALTIHNNPYRPKKVWPPDFSKLTQKEQFRFEKRYKRRVKHISARPRWNRFIKLTQLFSITFVIVYSVLFMDWKDEHQPFEEVRQRFWNYFGSLTPKQRFERRTDAPDATSTSR